MEFIDELLGVILFFFTVIWLIIEKAWFVLLPLLIVFGCIWLRFARCPKCTSPFTSHHSMMTPQGGHQADWYPVIDRETGDWYAVRYNRVCSECNHKWASGLHTDPYDPRPHRKKIYDKKTWKAFEDHIKNGGKILD